MIYFRSTITALNAHITELQVRLAASESERRELQDRLLLRANSTPIIERESPVDVKVPVMNFIAPPGVNPPDIQDLLKETWIQNETNYFIGQGFEYDRAKGQAEQNYKDQHGYNN